MHTLSQFRLSDGPMLPGGGFDAYREFQTGLLFHDMRKKPSYASFRCPFVAPPPRQAACASGARSAPAAATTVTLERKRGGGWKRGRHRPDHPPRLLAAQSVRKRSGTYRYRWGRGGPRRTSDHIRVR